MLTHELRAFLDENDVSFKEWGTGGAKTFDNLLSEIVSGEAILGMKRGALCRSIEVSVLNVYHDDGTNLWLLYEENQVFADGRSRVRDLDKSIGEKKRQGETPLHTARRALAEELGIKETLSLIPKPMTKRGPLPSLSFPGLLTFYRVHAFDVFLPPHLYRADGYIERQKDKISYFSWKRHRKLEARA